LLVRNNRASSLVMAFSSKTVLEKNFRMLSGVWFMVVVLSLLSRVVRRRVAGIGRRKYHCMKFLDCRFALFYRKRIQILNHHRSSNLSFRCGPNFFRVRSKKNRTDTRLRQETAYIGNHDVFPVQFQGSVARDRDGLSHHFSGR